jgi:hypothetical protein
LFGLCPELLYQRFGYELANVSYKNELELVVGHWHAKKNVSHPNTHQLFGHSQ